MTVNSFAGNGGMMETNHPPFSHDHLSGKFFLFTVAKTALRRRRFQNIEDIMSKVFAELNAVSLNAFDGVF
jgi:hypothetical protein